MPHAAVLLYLVFPVAIAHSAAGVSSRLRFPLSVASTREVDTHRDPDLGALLDSAIAGAKEQKPIVWPVEKPDPKSGYPDPLGRDETSSGSDAKATFSSGSENKTSSGSEAKTNSTPPCSMNPCSINQTSGTPGCPPCSMNPVARCPRPDCSKEAGQAAAAVDAANAAALKATQAAAALPSKEALEAHVLARYAISQSRTAVDTALRAKAEAESGAGAFKRLRRDLRFAASARAAALGNVEVKPPVMPMFP